MLGKKEKKDLMSDAAATDLLREWGEFFERDVESKLFQDDIEDIIMAVRYNKVKFNMEDKTFDLILQRPIEKLDGEKIEMVTIRSLSMQDKQASSKYKNDGDKNISFMAKLLDLDFGFAARIKDPDMGRIYSIAGCFFLQTAFGAKSES